MRVVIARGVALLLVILSLAGCVPNEPSSKELAATREFATVMSGATSLRTGGLDAQWSIDGSNDAYATELFVTHKDAGAVMRWYTALSETADWRYTATGYVAMSDGRPTLLAWRRGNLVVGLGFPDRSWLQHLGQDYPEGTLYEVTITYRPPPSPSAWGVRRSPDLV